LDTLLYSFPVSNVQTWLWTPPLAAFGISLFTSMVGVSGAFLLLPFQMSWLGFTGPAVSATNLVFNLVATPGGIYRYWREGRMAWPVAAIILAGTVPGTLAGWFLRIHYLPDPQRFRIFAGAMLLYVGGQVLYGLAAHRRRRDGAAPRRPPRTSPVSSTRWSAHAPVLETVQIDPRRIALRFGGYSISFSLPAMLALSLAVGIAGGIYGIGGGAIIAPLCVVLFRLPVYVVASAALSATLVTSAFGVALYSLLPGPTGAPAAPDWSLGLLFGVGGFAGMYCGARLQRFVPETLLKLGLGAVLLLLALRYLAPLATGL